MDTDVVPECSCFPPPPEFNVSPPPKPFAFMSLTEEEVETFQNDDYCPLYLFESLNVPSDKNLLQINEPLLALVVITICIIVVLFGCAIAFWCRKRRCLPKVIKCLPSNNVTTSNYSNNSNFNRKVLIIPDHEINLQTVANAEMQLYGCSNDFDFKESLEQYPINNCPSLGKHKRKLSFSDTYNPIYEEISLNGLPFGSIKSRNSPSDYLNETESKSLLNSNHMDDIKLQCKICQKLEQNSFSNEIGRLRFSGEIDNCCKCTLNVLADNAEIYHTNRSETNRMSEYLHKAAFV